MLSIVTEKRKLFNFERRSVLRSMLNIRLQEMLLDEVGSGAGLGTRPTHLTLDGSGRGLLPLSLMTSSVHDDFSEAFWDDDASP